MGLRKTKTFAATVEAMARDIESKVSPGDAVYFPTLVLNPVPTIHQTHAEFKRHFPGLNVILYYSVKSQARKFGGANVIEKGHFLRFLKKLNPASGRVVVLTTYSTIQRRDVVKTYQRFKFGEPPLSTPMPKRRKVLEVADSAYTITDADPQEIANSQESNSISKDKNPSKVQMLSEKLRVYHDSDPEIQNRRPIILPDGDRRTPDGILKRYQFIKQQLSQHPLGPSDCRRGTHYPQRFQRL